VTTEFQPWPKIARLTNAQMTITEKIDGTNAQVHIYGSAEDTSVQFMSACSRNKVLNTITLVDGKYHHVDSYSDNYGFGAWVIEEAEELIKLGEGRHYGEWWGQGIQRGYGVEGKYFSLFNARRWTTPFRDLDAGLPAVFPRSCLVVPLMHISQFDQGAITENMMRLKSGGSWAARERGVEFMNPEGIIIEFAGTHYKETYEFSDGKWKEAA